MQDYDNENFTLGRSIPNLRGYSLAAAMRLAFAFSSKSDDEIAAEMTWPPSTANRIFHSQDYWPSLPTLPKLCGVLNNDVIPRWIMDNSDSILGLVQPMDAPALFKVLREMMKEVAQLLEEGEHAMGDGKLVSLKARRILRALEDVFQVGCKMLSGLQAVIQQDKGTL
jgi:hypothetical protein